MLRGPVRRLVALLAVADAAAWLLAAAAPYHRGVRQAQAAELGLLLVLLLLAVTLVAQRRRAARELAQPLHPRPVPAAASRT